MRTTKMPQLSSKLGFKQGVYSGSDGLKSFLNPDNHPPLPLVELPAALNPYQHLGVHIYAKMMSFLPLANVKSLPAYNMLDGLAGTGSYDTIVESSSGNTVASLAVLAPYFGIQHTKALVSSEVSPGKLNLLRLLGVEIIVNEEPICPDPGDPDSSIFQARRMAEQPGWLNPGQYDNEANPGAHRRWTGPQLWEQTAGQIKVFCAGLGTTGTLMGTGGYLKSQNPAIRVVGVARKPNNLVPGVRTKNLLEEVGFDWREVCDKLMEIGTPESFSGSLKLCRAGLLAGPSSGFAYEGLLHYLGELVEAGRLDELKDEHGEITAVFLSPDSPFPYLDEYFEYLDESNFPAIINADLLQSVPLESTATVASIDEDIAVTAPELIKRAYRAGTAPDGTSDELALVKPGVRLVDVRTEREFTDHHLAGSRRVDLKEVTAHPEQYVDAEEQMIFICAHGRRSLIAAQAARGAGFTDTYSLAGGTAAWSADGLPRVTPESCAVKPGTSR